MTAARAAVATPATKPAQRAAAGTRQRAQPQAAAADSVQPLRPGSRCACGGGCPRCSSSRDPSREASSTDLHEREAQALSPRLLQSPASRAAAPASGSTAQASRTNTAAAVAGRPRAATSPPATGPPKARHRPITTAGPRSLGAGRSLSALERERFELPLARDLGGVRVHDGPPAESAAAEQRAHAFTYGSHIVLGRAAQRAPEGMRLAVLAHELVHVGQQTGAQAANNERYDHQARAPPELRLVPALSPAPLGVMCLSDDDDSIIPQWASDAAGAVADAGTGAFDTAADAAGSVAQFAVDTAATVVDELAPGLLPFLRGGALGQLTDLFCGGIDTLLGSLFSSLGEIDFMSAIETTFTSLAEGVRELQATIGSTASEAVGSVLGPLVEALQAWGGPLVETIQSIATSVNDLFGSVWDNLAVPALDILEQMGGVVLRGFNDLVGWVWDLCEPIRTGAETAWNWLLEAFDLGWNSSAGVRTWLGEMASSAWTAFLETIEPIREPLRIAGGIALLLSPVGPIIVLTQVVPPLWEKITWLWNNWNTEDILVRAQDTLRDDVLPAILGTVSGVASAIGSAASWLAELVGSFGNAMSGVLGVFGANSCLSAVTTYLNAVAGQFERLAAWAESGFDGLSEALQAVFDALLAFFQPIFDFLVRLFIVALNPPMLPFAIAGAIWLLCPDPLKPPVIDFVLDLLIAFVDGSTALLIGLGPMALVLQAGMLGFLRELRSGEGISDKQRIDASNKIANLAAGGGPAFVLGFALGFLHGVLDGIIDPFRLIFLVGRFLVTAAMAIGRALAPYVTSTVPGAAAAVAGVRDSLALPPSTAPPAAMPESTDSAAPTATSTTTPETTAPATASAPASGAAAMAAPDEVAPAAAPTGAGASAEELPPLESMPGDLSDAEVAAALGPGTRAEVSAAAAEAPIDEATLAGEMRGEMETRGATVGGLARLLGDGWDWIMQGADSLGRSAAVAFVEFILQPDFQLGRKIGFVCGFVALQALIIYLSAGTYAALKGLEPGIRQLLTYFLRFLDLGGEILGLLGRALRPFRGPLMRGLGAARGWLSRFRFARGLIERIERLAGTMFRFGDEAAAVGSRGAREVAEETGERAASEGAERGSREVAENTGEGAARRATTEEAAELARRKAVELPMALAAARGIAVANDVVNTPVPALLLLLNGLRARFRWIDGFRVTPKANPGVFEVDMLASIHNVVPTYTTLPTTPAEITGRVAALRNSGRITAQRRVGRSGADTVTAQLDDIERRALAGEVGAQGEIAALERKVFDQGQTVELIPGTRIQGRGRPDMRAPAQGARELLDVKTTTTARSDRGWERWFKHQVTDVNSQIGTSRLVAGRPGAAELQAFGPASASLRAQPADEVSRWVLGNFNAARGRELQRVSIFADGSLLYEFTRGPTGSVVRTFPP